MTYEEEQEKYTAELKKISREIKELDEIINDPDKMEALIRQMSGPYESQISRFTYNCGYSARRNEIKKRLEDTYQEKTLRKVQLERLLAQTPSQRKKENIVDGLYKTAEFIGSITPQHVSGRVYRVENGDGCGTFCLWFIIIDAIIVGIICLCLQ